VRVCAARAAAPGEAPVSAQSSGGALRRRARKLSVSDCMHARTAAGRLSPCRVPGIQAGGIHCACRAPRVLFPNLCMRWARWRAGLLLLCVWHAPCASLPARASPARRNQPTSLRGQKACAGWCVHARSRACVCPRPSWVAMRCVCVSTHNSGARSIECGVLHSPARGDPQSASQPGRQHQHHDSKVLLLLLLASVACLPGHRYDVPGLLRALHLLGVNCAPLPGYSQTLNG
jgi:hypothetical protein